MSYAFLWEEEAILSLLLTFLGSIPSGVLGIACYVLSSMALYTIAQRRQIQKPWLAWIPLLNCWILGSLSDQYRYLVKGQIKSKRKWLLALSILLLLMGTILAGVLISMFVSALLSEGRHPDPMIFEITMALGILGILSLVSILRTVFRFLALYDVYVSVDPANAVLFLVLSIFVGIVEPFFLFFNREKDRGMPPRRDRQPQEAPTLEDKDYL